MKNRRCRWQRLFLLYKENHSLGEWFKKAYGDEKAKETPFAII